jgi:hypothetical protein
VRVNKFNNAGIVTFNFLNAWVAILQLWRREQGNDFIVINLSIQFHIQYPEKYTVNEGEPPVLAVLEMNCCGVLIVSPEKLRESVFPAPSVADAICWLTRLVSEFTVRLIAERAELPICNSPNTSTAFAGITPDAFTTWFVTLTEHYQAGHGDDAVVYMKVKADLKV